MTPEFGCRNALLLQGPMGPFFRRFGEELRAGGAKVTKVNFNAGDALYYRGPDVIAFRGTLEDWPAVLREIIAKREIDAIFVFGDARPMHAAASEVARSMGVTVWAFEEGYLRPGYVTLERGGVNVRSPLPREASAYKRAPAVVPKRPPGPSNTFFWSAWHSSLYVIALTLLGFRYPRYVHHRPLNAWLEAPRWWLSGGRKLWFSFRERKVLPRLVGARAKAYFLVCLQVHCDAQLQASTFASVEAFIEHVVASFAVHGRPGDALVVKHHPADRAYREYGAFCRRLAAKYGLGDRLIYVHDLHLPSLLRAARGAVMINSTVGLSAAAHGIPVKVLGGAVYNLAGITHRGTLEEFWQKPGKVNQQLVKAFQAWLLRHNQAVGSFYVRTPGTPGAAGLHWFPKLPPPERGGRSR